jgi:trigger factor
VKVTLEQSGICQVKLQVEVEPERFEKVRQKAAQRLSQEVKIPGFRPGKAPYELIERKVGRDLINAQALDTISKDIYHEALREANVTPFGPADLDVPQWDPLIVEFIVPTKPVVDLGDYQQVRVPLEEPHIDESQVDAVLERIRVDHAHVVPVDRPLIWGDVANLSIRGTAEGRQALSAEGQMYTLNKDRDPLVPGFGEHLLGLNKGQEKQFTLTYPKTYPDPQFADKEVAFTVTVHDVKERQLPPLDDDLARTASDFHSLDALKTDIRRRLLADEQRQAEQRYELAALDAVVAQAKIEFPALMLEEVIDEIMKEREETLRRTGFTLKRYLEMNNKTETEFREEARPQAEQRLKRGLVLGKLAEAERITVDPDEIDDEIDGRIEWVESVGGNGEEARRSLSTPETRDDVENQLLTWKAIDRVVDITSGGQIRRRVGDILVPRKPEVAAEERPILTPEQMRQEKAKAAPPVLTPDDVSGVKESSRGKTVLRPSDVEVKHERP